MMQVRSCLAANKLPACNPRLVTEHEATVSSGELNGLLGPNTTAMVLQAVNAIIILSAELTVVLAGGPVNLPARAVKAQAL